jgi:hypothetical protein
MILKYEGQSSGTRYGIFRCQASCPSKYKTPESQEFHTNVLKKEAGEFLRERGVAA